jgi:hypothetical protein
MYEYVIEILDLNILESKRELRKLNNTNVYISYSTIKRVIEPIDAGLLTLEEDKLIINCKNVMLILRINDTIKRIKGTKNGNNVLRLIFVDNSCLDIRTNNL